MANDTIQDETRIGKVISFLQQHDAIVVDSSHSDYIKASLVDRNSQAGGLGDAMAYLLKGMKIVDENNQVLFDDSIISHATDIGVDFGK